MRPKNLKPPFGWEERRPLLQEGVLFVPPYFDKHGEWKDETGVFSPDQSIFLEYCSGNGDWVIEKALQNPKTSWIAVEKKFERVRKIWSKMHNLQVKNLLIVCGEALTFTRNYLPSGSIQEIFMNFPDPWPKQKHAKNRLVQAPFITELSRIVKPLGKATFVTDDYPYTSQIIQTVSRDSQWRNQFGAPFYTKEWENYGTSWFENIWRKEGREVYYMQFERVK